MRAWCRVGRSVWTLFVGRDDEGGRGGFALAGLSSFFTRPSATALYGGQRIGLQKGLAAVASWRAHLVDQIRHLGIAMCMPVAGGLLR